MIPDENDSSCTGCRKRQGLYSSEYQNQLFFGTSQLVKCSYLFVLVRFVGKRWMGIASLGLGLGLGLGLLRLGLGLLRLGLGLGLGLGLQKKISEKAGWAGGSSN